MSPDQLTNGQVMVKLRQRLRAQSKGRSPEQPVRLSAARDSRSSQNRRGTQGKVASKRNRKPRTHAQPAKPRKPTSKIRKQSAHGTRSEAREQPAKAKQAKLAIARSQSTSKMLSLERKAAERSVEAARTARPHEQHRSLPATPAKNRGIGQATRSG